MKQRKASPMVYPTNNSKPAASESKSFAHRAQAGQYKKPGFQNTWTNRQLGAQEFDGGPRVTIKSDDEFEENNNEEKSATSRRFYFRRQET